MHSLAVKRVLVTCFFPIFSFLNRFVPKDDRIILIYCANGRLNDNAEALYDYLLEHGYDEKYRIICGGVKNLSDRVSCISKSRSLFQYMRSGHVFYSVGKIPIKPSADQCVINMWHGTPLKKIGLLSGINNGKEYFFSYVCATSEYIKPVIAAAFGCPDTTVFINSEPKADRLFLKKGERDRKLVVWVPTFRRSAFLGYDDSEMKELIPLFEENEWESLNELLKENNTDVIVKLHPSQDLHGFSFREFSHLKIYSHNAYQERGVELFELLSQSDALVTDYSSVYMNYLMVDRPICFVIPDVEEYGDKRGFVFENPLDYMPGRIVKDKDGLADFLQNFAFDVANYREERKRVNDLINFYNDGMGCRRVLEKSGIFSDDTGTE